MTILLDQGLPRSSAGLLRNAGLDAIHTGECGLARAADATILDLARAEDRIVVTVDSDFHALLATTNANGPSVVRIRIEGLRAEAAAGLLQSVLEQCRDDLTAGAVVSVEEDRIRTRRLPIGPPVRANDRER